MELTIRGSPEEMAALVLAVQGRPSETLVDTVAEGLSNGFQKAVAGSSPSSAL